MKKVFNNKIFLFVFLMMSSFLQFSSIQSAAIEAELMEGVSSSLTSALREAGMAAEEGLDTGLVDAMKGSATESLNLQEISGALGQVEDGVQAQVKQTMQDSIQTQMKEAATGALEQLKGETGNFIENNTLTAEGEVRFQDLFKEKIGEARGAVNDAVVEKIGQLRDAGKAVFKDTADINQFMETFGSNAQELPAIGQGAAPEGGVAGAIGGGVDAVEDMFAQLGLDPNEALNAEDAVAVAGGGAAQPELVAVRTPIKDAVARGFTKIGDAFSDMGSWFSRNAEGLGDKIDSAFSTRSTQEEFGAARNTYREADLRVQKDEAFVKARQLDPGQAEYTAGRGQVKISDATSFGDADLGHINDQLMSGNAEIKVEEGEMIVRVRGKGKTNIEIKLEGQAGGFKVDGNRLVLEGGEPVPLESEGTVDLVNGEDLASGGKHLEKSVTNGEARLVKVKGGGYRLEYGDGDFSVETVTREKMPNEVQIKENLEARDAALQEMRDSSSNIRKLGRGVKNLIIGTFNKIVGLLEATAMLLAQAAAFTVPSVLYQQTVEKEQLESLRRTIGAPQQFGDLILQIPPSLVSQDDPLRSSFLYCQVPSLNDGQPYGDDYFTEERLRNADFFVAYSGSYSDWATTYIGSSSFTGQIVCLGKGWVFTGQGIAVDASNPTYPLRPQGPKTVETFTNTFVAKSGEQTFEHQSSLQDWVPLGIQKGLGINEGPELGTASGNPIIVKLFRTPLADSSANNDLPGADNFNPAPLLFASTIATYRNGTILTQFGGVKLRQMQGTGYLNTLLDKNIDWSNTALQAALNDLVAAEKSYHETMAGLSGQTGSVDDLLKKEQEAASNIALKEQAVANALKNNNVVTGLLGFSPEENINLRNLFVYEIDPVMDASGKPTGVLTPALQALYKNKQVLVAGSNGAEPAKIPAFLPTKDYIVCLDENYQIVPLQVPTVIKNPKKEDSVQSSNGTTFPPLGSVVTYQTNPNIVYLASLTTGLSYIVRKSQDLSPMRNQDGTVNFSIATAAFNAIAALLKDNKGVLNQIIAMANYTTEKAMKGPFKTLSGMQLEEVPLDRLAQGNPVAQQESLVRSMSDVLNGAVSASAAQLKLQTFTDAQKQSLLPNIYVYKVMNSDGTGALSTTVMDQETGAVKHYDIPDYVVAVGLSSDGNRFQIMPLGIDQITGGLGSNGVNALFSLVTGRGYDVEYVPLPRWYTVDVIPRTPTTYFPINGSAQGAYEGLSVGSASEQISVPQQDASGKITMQTVSVKMFPSVWLGTAYMPTEVNPYNRIFASDQAAQSVKQTYDTARQTIIANSKTLSTLAQIFPGMPASAIQYALSHPTQEELQAAGFPNPQLLASQIANAQVANANYATLAQQMNQADSTIKQLQYQMDTQDNPPLLIPRPENERMNIPPLYFAFFSNFEICTQGGNTYQLSSSVTPGANTSLNWVYTKPCEKAQPLGKTVGDQIAYIPLAGALPSGFSGFNIAEYISPGNVEQGQKAQNQYYESAKDPETGVVYPSLLSVYTDWMHAQEASKYWVQSAFMGPLNFTNRVNNNVYISATSRADVARGNFFYQASGFPATSVFVCANGPTNGQISGISDLKDIGKPYQFGKQTGTYLIDIGTGAVYTPYGTSVMSYPDACCVSAAQYPQYAVAQGNNCSLQPVGQNVFPGSAGSCARQVSNVVPTRTGTQLRLNAQEVLSQALANQGSVGKAVTMNDLTQGLRALIENAQAIGTQELQRSLFPQYFKNLQLRLTEKQISDGTYIYAYVPNGESYNAASDYLVVWDVSVAGAFKQAGCEPVTPYTKAMISLVTGTLYQDDGLVVDNYYATTYKVQQSSDVPNKLIMNVQVGSYDEATQKYTPKTVDPVLAKRIQDLNTQYLANQKVQAPAQYGIEGVPQLTKSQVASATAVGNNNLYSMTIDGKTKYFYKSKTSMTSTSGGKDVTTSYDVYFDFNATSAAVDANRGVYYKIDVDGTPEAFSALSGFELQATRLSHGVSVAADGTESLHLPVTNLSIPLAPQDPNNPDGPKEASLIPLDGSGVPQFGKDGTYMKFITSIGTITNAELGQEYYYYRHTQINAYFALVKDTRGLLIGNNPQYPSNNNAAPQKIIQPAYFVDLMSGDEYDLQGNPRLKQVFAAYGFIQRPMAVIMPFESAPDLPLDKLKAAAPVGGAHPDLYFVDGKYYLKETVENARLIDQYGNGLQGAQKTGTVTRYFDFAGNNSSTVITGKDSGFGSYYQIANDAVAKKEVAVPIDNFKDLPAHNSFPLRNMRLYYGVQVAPDGTQSLTDPVTQGVNVNQPLFMWGEEDPINDQSSFQLIGDLDGSGENKLFMYVANSTIFKFVDAAGKNVTTFQLNPIGANNSLVPQKITYSLADMINQTTATLAPSGDTTGLTDDQKAQLAFSQGINKAVSDGLILFQLEHQVSSSGLAGNAYIVTESMLSPKIYTIGGQNYVESGVPNHTYQTIWTHPREGMSAAALAQFNKDQAELKKQYDAIVWGIPFVAHGLGARKASETTAAPTGSAIEGTPLVGVLNKDTKGLIGFIPQADGQFYTGEGNETPGQPSPYISNMGFLNAFTSTYPLTGNQSIAGSMAGGKYIAIISDDDNYESMQSLYTFDYAYVSDTQLNAIKSQVNVVATTVGGLSLVPEINTADLTSVTVPAGTIGNTYIKGVTGSTPRILYQVPPTAVVQAYYQAHPKTYTLANGTTITAMDNYNNTIGQLAPGIYIDYTSGVVFANDVNRTGYLYPTGFALSDDQIKIIKEQFNGAIAGYDGNALSLKLPEQIVDKDLPGYAQATPQGQATPAGG